MLLDKMLETTKLSISQLEWYAETASRRYKSYYLLKRDGGKREIHHPSRQLKNLQRLLNVLLLRKFEVHQAATAYRKSRNILHNAQAHAASNFTLHCDVKNFFPSFTKDGVEAFLRDLNIRGKASMSDADIVFVSKIVCRHNKLTIGAPSSPMLTNAMMFSFDSQLHDWSRAKELVYTRYADDIFISATAPDQLADAQIAICRALDDYSYADLQLNQGKTAYLSRKRRRRIAGITITTERSLSIGLERKLAIKKLVYQFTSGKLAPELVSSLAGHISFVESVDPSFFNVLLRKYGLENLRKIRK
jgi:RNA-directed DNA polymerase